jgi:TonB family protein
MRINLIFFYLLIFHVSNAQDVFTHYFDATEKLTNDSERSRYFVVGKAFYSVNPVGDSFDTVLTYIDTARAYYTKSKTLKFIKTYDNEGNLHGGYVEYFENGKIKERGVYDRGWIPGPVTYYHENGKFKMTLVFTNAKKDNSDLPDYQLIRYADETGKVIVVDGNGFCHCKILSDNMQVGKVVAGQKDSTWLEYHNDSLAYEENYDAGKLIQGFRYTNSKIISYDALEQFPIYESGAEGMARVIQRNIKYPSHLRSERIAGNVYTQFTILENGTIANLKVLKGVHPLLDDEALRVVKLLARWKPRILRGLPATSSYILPIAFKLN